MWWLLYKYWYSSPEGCKWVIDIELPSHPLGLDQWPRRWPKWERHQNFSLPTAITIKMILSNRTVIKNIYYCYFKEYYKSVDACDPEKIHTNNPGHTTHFQPWLTRMLLHVFFSSLHDINTHIHSINDCRYTAARYTFRMLITLVLMIILVFQ